MLGQTREILVIPIVGAAELGFEKWQFMHVDVISMNLSRVYS